VTTLDGAQVEVELGEQVNVNLVGIVGPVGPVGPIGPPGGPMAGWFTPQQFGGVGDGVHDDTAAVQAAISAAGTAGGLGHGGVVYFAPGTYNCAAALHYNGNTMWVGAGPSASVLKCTAELWAGGTTRAAPFISAGAALNQFQNWRMSNMALRGPGATNAPVGQTPCKTTGIQTGGGGQYGSIVDNVNIQGFFAGVAVIGDHNTFNCLFSAGNYYGVEYPDNALTYGNNSFYSCNLTANKLASLHVSGGNQIVGDYFTQIHMGWGPVGILKTDNQNGWDASGNPVYTGGTVSNSVLCVAAMFDVIAFEYVGNGAILDISGSPAGTIGINSKFLNIGLTWNATYYTPNAPLTADCLALWSFLHRSSSMTARFEFNGSPAAPPSGYGVLKSVVTSTRIQPTFRFVAGIPANLYGSGTNWSQQHSSYHELRQSGQATNTSAYGVTGDLVTMASTAVINIGDCVEILHAAGGTIQRASGTLPVFGVALTPSPGGGPTVPVMVQVNGYTAINSTLAGGIYASDLLYLDATTPYMVNNTNTAGRIVGMGTGFVSQLSGQNTVPAQLRPQLK
jgi:hypothetical protein